MNTSAETSQPLATASLRNVYMVFTLTPSVFEICSAVFGGRRPDSIATAALRASRCSIRFPLGMD